MRDRRADAEPRRCADYIRVDGRCAARIEILGADVHGLVEIAHEMHEQPQGIAVGQVDLRLGSWLIAPQLLDAVTDHLHDIAIVGSRGAG